MTAIVSLFTILAISLLINRIATRILIHSGLSRGLAQFQARSAFTGVGYTTEEAEKIVGHPVRRRVVMLLMLLGNAGIVTAISSLLLTFLDPGKTSNWGSRIIIVIFGVAILWLLATNRWVDQVLSHLTTWALSRWTRLDVRDYVSLLHLAGEYRVTELTVNEDDWLAHQTLQQLGLRQEGVFILGIQRQNGRYIGTPTGHYYIRPHDILLAYGRANSLAELDERRSGLRGEIAHQEAISEQHQRIRAQDKAEEFSQNQENEPRIRE